MQLKKEIWLSKEWLSKKQKNRNDPNWSPVFSDDQNYLCFCFLKEEKSRRKRKKKMGKHKNTQNTQHYQGNQWQKSQ